MTNMLIKIWVLVLFTVQCPLLPRWFILNVTCSSGSSYSMTCTTSPTSKLSSSTSSAWYLQAAFTQIDTEIVRQMDKYRERQIDRCIHVLGLVLVGSLHLDRYRDRQILRQIDTPTSKIDRYSHRQIGSWIQRYIDRQIQIQIQPRPQPGTCRQPSPRQIDMY